MGTEYEHMEVLAMKYANTQPNSEWGAAKNGYMAGAQDYYPLGCSLADALEATAESLNLLAASNQIQVEGAKLKSDAPDTFGCMRALDMANKALKQYKNLINDKS